MVTTAAVQKILSYYESDTPGTKTNLARLLMAGQLAGTGKLLILAVDQGFEHGPLRMFGMNKSAMDPLYHFDLATSNGLSGFAAPLGLLEAGANTYAGQVPLILKMNSSNNLSNAGAPNQAITASLEDALRLGCVGIGFTIYPGSEYCYDMFEQIKELSLEAKSLGLCVVIWSYPRGNMSKAGETALDIISYSAHMACLLGGHIIKVKIPTSYFENKEDEKILQSNSIPHETLEDRIRYIKSCCFEGRRIVIFSGGVKQSTERLIEETHAIHTAGGFGSIIGRNIFQRSREESTTVLQKIIDIYKAS